MNIERRFPPLWSTVEIGAGPRTGRAFLAAIEEMCAIEVRAREVIEQPEFTRLLERITAPEDIELSMVSAEELTGHDAPVWSEIYRRARVIGVEVSPEIPLQLLLQDPQIPRDTTVRFVMEPLRAPNGNPAIFCIERRGRDKPQLALATGDPAFRWHGTSTWAFALKRA